LSLTLALHCGFGSLETNFGMCPVAKWLVHGAAAATEGDGRFSGQIVLVAFSIGKVELTQIAAYDVGAILLGQDIDSLLFLRDSFTSNRQSKC
jgi:hypothetical protein